MNIPEEVVLEDKDCPLGCPKSDEVFLSGRDRLHNLPGKYTVVKCRTCGLMRTNPRPTPDTIGYYYPEDYGPYLSTRIQQGKKKQNSNLKIPFKHFKNRIFQFNTEIIPSLRPGRLLEVGCASGSFLHKMVSQGWQVQGIEYSEKVAESARASGYQVYAGSLETAPTPKEKFDLVVGWMVLEHLHDPIGCLKKLSEWTKSGAWLVLSVPNATSLEFRVFKDRWYALQLPTHLCHFTPATLDKVLHVGGWELKAVHHQRVLSNLVVSSGYFLLDKGFARMGQKLVSFPSWAGRWNYVFYPLSWFLSIFGQTGRMTVWAVKSD